MVENILNELKIQKATFARALGISRQSLINKLERNTKEGTFDFKDKQKRLILYIFGVKDYNEITLENAIANKEHIKQKIKLAIDNLNAEKLFGVLDLDLDKTKLFYKQANFVINILKDDNKSNGFTNINFLDVIIELLEGYRKNSLEVKYLFIFIAKSYVLFDKDSYPGELNKEICKYFEANLFKVFEDYRNKNFIYDVKDLENFHKLIQQNSDWNNERKRSKHDLAKSIQLILSRDDLTEEEKNTLIRLETEKSLAND